jgi:DNA-binding response OmpR family regulator
MSIECPCCHQPTTGLAPESLSAFVQFSPSERKVFDVLASRFGRDVPTPFLLDCLYRERPDGGPECAETTLHVFAHKLRKKIQPYGYDIRGRSGTGNGEGGLYRMSWLNGKAQ